MKRLFFLIAAWALMPGQGFAAPIPAPVETMIRAAAGTDALGSVANTAKKAFPDSVKEIDSLVAALRKEATARRTARLAQAGFFDAWSGEGEAGVSRTTGNTRDFGVVLGYELRKDGLHFRHKMSGLVDWQRSNGVLTRNRYAADYELNYKFNNRLYAYGLFGWERNTFAGFTRRFSESFGAGYSVLKNDDMTLDITAGPAFQQTHGTDGLNHYQHSGRASLDFNWHIFEKLTFGQEAAIYLGNQITSTTSLSAKINGGLSTRLSFDIVRESDPPAGRRAVDTLSRLSLVYGF